VLELLRISASLVLRAGTSSGKYKLRGGGQFWCRLNKTSSVLWKYAFHFGCWIVFNAHKQFICRLPGFFANENQIKFISPCLSRLNFTSNRIWFFPRDSSWLSDLLPLYAPEFG
jgi:hypothetical protein